MEAMILSAYPWMAVVNLSFSIVCHALEMPWLVILLKPHARSTLLLLIFKVPCLTNSFSLLYLAQLISCPDECPISNAMGLPTLAALLPLGVYASAK